MLELEDQLDRGALVCPDTRQRLVADAGALFTVDGERRFEIVNGVPILLPMRSVADNPEAARGAAARAAGPRRLTRLQTKLDRLLGFVGDQRSSASTDAWTRFTGRLSDEEICLAVGGGPTRFHPALVNLNVEPLDDVDIVGDAHYLPYADASVAAIQCEAVLEHLEDPFRAVEEMFRVLRPGGETYCITPFLQGFHGYPNNYFNPTREGHRHLFERVGFEVADAGVCVGPSWMISSLMVEYLSLLVPLRGIRAAVMIAARIVFLPLPLLDRWLNRSPRSHVLAATTFVHAVKPEI
jgi:SAM-dependent methyltransferase